MNKTIKYSAIILLFALQGGGCEEKIVYEESPEAGSIAVGGIDDNTIHVYTGETFQVEMNVLPEDAILPAEVKYDYSSGNKQIFTVDDKGVVRGIAPGEAVLYVEASNYDGLKTSAVVSVTDEFHSVAEIKIDDRLKNFTLAIGDEITVDEYIEILPANASNKEYTLESSNGEVLAVTQSGSIKALAIGNVTLTIKAKDGSGVAATCNIAVKEPVYNALSRTAWTVAPSHDLPADAAIENAPASLIDGKISTCLSMVKPGKEYSGIKVLEDEQVFFVIDMKEISAFNYCKIFHRTSNTQLYLRVWGVSFFGSNDGVTFVPVSENIPVEYNGVNSHTIRLMEKSNYRYLKVLYTDWDIKSGNTIQIAEFELGTFGF